MVRVGKLSYSLYLVHWPLIVLYRHYYGPQLSQADCAILLLASFVLALALNRGVELPFRLAGDGRLIRAGLPAARVMWMTARVVLLTSAFTVTIIRADGWPGRLPQHLQELSRLDQPHFTREQQLIMEKHCQPAGKVFCGEPVEGGLNIMLLGDSRALDLCVALSRAYPQANIYVSCALGCTPVFDANIGKSLHYARCPQLNSERLAAALGAPRGANLFLAMDFNDWRGTFVLDAARRLAESGKRVYVLGQYRIHARDGKQLLTFDGIHLTTAGAQEFGDHLAREYPITR